MKAILTRGLERPPAPPPVEVLKGVELNLSAEEARMLHAVVGSICIEYGRLKISYGTHDYLAQMDARAVREFVGKLYDAMTGVRKGDPRAKGTGTE